MTQTVETYYFLKDGSAPDATKQEVDNLSEAIRLAKEAGGKAEFGVIWTDPTHQRADAAVYMNISEYEHFADDKADSIRQRKKDLGF